MTRLHGLAVAATLTSLGCPGCNQARADEARVGDALPDGNGSATSIAPGAAQVGAARPLPSVATVASSVPTVESRAVVAPTSAAPAAPADIDADGEPPPCPADMALVEGSFCRHVEQRCLEPTRDAKGGLDRSRCARFDQPSRCISPNPVPRAMRFCMDRYEYPNREGELPVTLVAWNDAQHLCQAAGKRLCTESEFSFACEGEEMRPYATGFTRDAGKCNFDRPFRARRIDLKEHAACKLDPTCRAEFERLDQREPSGARPDCVSPFGIFDLNGNVNEWVSMPWKEPPHRAAIKGGWWGPVRNRCRPIVTSHDETYVGYEVGFRCCADPSAPAQPPAGPSAQQRKPIW